MHKHLLWAAGALVACAVATVLVAAFVPMYFAHPLADDLARWHEGARDGWFSVMRHNYLDWSGRWAATGLEGAVLPYLAGHRYGLALAVLAVIQLAACYAFVRLMLGECLTRRISLGLATCFFALYWSGMPAPGETVYWISGGIEYQLSISLATIVLWLAAAMPDSGLVRGLCVASICLVILFLTGLHELTALMLAVALAIAASVSYRRRDGRLGTWCCWLAVATAGLFVNGLAPGNAARASVFVNAHSIPKTLGLTAKFMLRDVSIWIADPRLLSASLFLFLSPWFARLRPAWLGWAGIDWRRILPGVGALFLILGAAIPAFATNCSPPGRAENLLYFVFLTTWFATLLACTRWPENWILRGEPPAPLLQAAALGILGLSLACTGNTSSALRDFDKRIVRWHQAMQLREELAATAARGVDLVVPAMPPLPAVFFDNDISRDPGEWQNQLFANFYGLSTVRLETELDRVPRQAAIPQTSRLK